MLSNLLQSFLQGNVDQLVFNHIHLCHKTSEIMKCSIVTAVFVILSIRGISRISRGQPPEMFNFKHWIDNDVHVRPRWHLPSAHRNLRLVVNFIFHLRDSKFCAVTDYELSTLSSSSD